MNLISSLRARDDPVAFLTFNPKISFENFGEERSTAVRNQRIPIQRYAPQARHVIEHGILIGQTFFLLMT